MGRLIFIGIVVVLVVWLLRRALAGPRPRGGEPDSRGGAPGEPGEQKGDLVSCAQCGVNLPKSEARSAGGRFFCSEEHWRLGPRDS
jgi:uncharacterized protein